MEQFAEKVKRAAVARDKHTGGQFIVCARTDARGVEGMDAVISRSKAYIDAGADMIFPEGLSSEEEFEHVAKELHGYAGKGDAPGGGPFLLANMTEFGKTPQIKRERFQELGYHCVIYPVSTLRVAMKAVNECLAAIQNEGGVESVLDDMLTRKELYEHLNYTPSTEYAYPDGDNKGNSGTFV